MSSDAYSSEPPPARGISTALIVALVIVGLVLSLCVIGLVTALVLPAVQAAREAARRNACQNQIKQIQLALFNYENTYRTFPPAYLADAEGRPAHSWRVLLLPSFGLPELQEIYDKYDFNEAWNGPNNSRLANKIGSVYACPSARHPGHETNYVAVVGPETAWPGANGVRMRDFRDGPAHSISTVEVADSGIHWMEPRDLNLDQALQGVNSQSATPGISSYHFAGALAGFADGHVAMLRSDLTPDELRALLTISGREPPPQMEW